ncbi:unnamed protein product, partial [Prorocentrum cordatum]
MIADAPFGKSSQAVVPRRPPPTGTTIVLDDSDESVKSVCLGTPQKEDTGKRRKEGEEKRRSRSRRKRRPAALAMGPLSPAAGRPRYCSCMWDEGGEEGCGDRILSPQRESWETHADTLHHA